MSLKTPVMILQELMVKKGVAPPVYTTEGSGASHCPQFSCLVLAQGKTAQGVGPTKKDAKQDAAKKLLECFGISLSSDKVPAICVMSSTPKGIETPFINYVGQLNEFATKRGMAPPKYVENTECFASEFKMTCIFGNAETVGRGLNKKDAKQDCARAMLNELNSMDFKNVPAISKAAVEFSEKEIAVIIEKYSETINKLTLDHPKSQEAFVQEPSIVNTLVTWDDMVSRLNHKEWPYNLSVFQEDPLILSLKVKDQTFLSSGPTYDEAKQELAESAFKMLDAYNTDRE